MKKIAKFVGMILYVCLTIPMIACGLCLVFLYKGIIGMLEFTQVYVSYSISVWEDLEEKKQSSTNVS